MDKARFAVVTAIILTAALTRLLPHSPNVTPITAMAIFGGACFTNKRSAFLVPLAAMLLSDAVLGFHRLMLLVYGCLALDVFLGMWVQKYRKFAPVAGVTLIGSIIFFVVTNFGVWAFETLYPRTGAGLAACFTAALPFFRNSLLGDLGYTMAMFGIFSLAQRAFPVLRASDAI